jgi:hypothetical protein
MLLTLLFEEAFAVTCTRPPVVALAVPFALCVAAAIEVVIWLTGAPPPVDAAGVACTCTSGIWDTGTPVLVLVFVSGTDEEVDVDDEPGTGTIDTIDTWTVVAEVEVIVDVNVDVTGADSVVIVVLDVVLTGQ